MGLALLLGACASDAEQKNQDKKEAKETLEVAQTPKGPVCDPALTGFARFIACMELDSSLVETAEPTFQSKLREEFAGLNTYSNEKWDRLQSRVGTPIGTWVGEQSYSNASEPKTLLYPFAGGDFYYGHLFNPQQDTIIMLGLESPGTLFDLTQFKTDTLTAYLKGLEKSMFFPHQLGFFRTKSMANDFETTLLNGTLHTALYYMGRMGYEIHYLYGVSNDSKLDLQAPLDKNSVGVRVGYSKAGEFDPVREWIYISQDISNGGLQTPKGQKVRQYLESRGSVVSFFKAASYLLHEDYFSTIRDLCLDQSKRILQDDSGVPYSVLKDHGYTVKLLGEYHRTIPLFSNNLQEDLKQAYAEQHPPVLPFNVGYNAQFHECNLQLATRP